MRMTALLFVVVLGVWALWGSVALAFDHCMAMSTVCEAPCGLTAFVEPVPALVGPAPLATVSLPLPLRLSTTALPAPDPVPKSLRPAA
jgi:hypothetical protein